MPIKIILQREHGEAVDQVLDPYGDLARSWPSGEESFPLLQYIDPYGHTVFNAMQMRQVIRELEVLKDQVTTDAAKSMIERVRELAARCRDTSHLYLSFVGD